MTFATIDYYTDAQYLGIAVAGVLAILTLFIPDAGRKSQRLKKSALILTIFGVILAMICQVLQNKEERERQNHFQTFESNVFTNFVRLATQFSRISVTIRFNLSDRIPGLTAIKTYIKLPPNRFGDAYILVLSPNYHIPSEIDPNVSKFLSFAQESFVEVAINSRTSTNSSPVQDIEIPPPFAGIQFEKEVIYDTKTDVVSLLWILLNYPASMAIQTRNIISVEDLGNAKVTLDIGGPPGSQILGTAATLNVFALNFDNEPVEPTVHKTNPNPGMIASYAGVFPSAETIRDFKVWQKQTNN